MTELTPPMTNPTPNPPPKKKPKWLKILEKQSWQAELVISGLAIFGSLQLPTLIDNIITSALFYFAEDYMEIFKYFFIYIYFAAVIMIISFVTHLALRTLWIGILGMASVFPNGINPDFKMYSKDYMQKLLRDFPDVGEFNKRLDDLCSSIFANAAAGTIIMLNIGILILVTLGIASLIHYFVPVVSLLSVFLVIFGLFFATAILMMIFALKTFREKEWVKRIHYPIAKRMGQLMYNVAFEPVMYIQLTFMSNAKTKVYAFANVLIYFLSMAVILPILLSSNWGYLNQDVFFDHTANPNYQYAEHYENLFPEKISILTPVIPSDVVSGKTIRLFIPFLGREQESADELCGVFEKPDKEVKKMERRKAKSKFRLACAEKYYKIYLNDTLITDVKFYQHEHPNNQENGYLTYLSTKNCQPMENILKVVSHYKNEEGELRTISIPFIFEE